MQWSPVFNDDGRIDGSSDEKWLIRDNLREPSQVGILRPGKFERLRSVAGFARIQRKSEPS